MEEFKFSTIEEAVADLRAGKMIIAVDDPDRENEGDLICAAEFATLENVNLHADEQGLDQEVGVGTDGCHEHG